MKKKISKKIVKKGEKPLKTKKGKRRAKIIKVKEIGMEMDKIYSIISECQTSRIEQELIVDPIDYPVVENILKDGEMTFLKREKSDGIHYVIQPPPEVVTSDDMYIFDEELENELKDEDQCF